MKLRTRVKNKILQWLNARRIDTTSMDRLEQLSHILDDGLGHINSYNSQRPVDAQNKPIPWFTYPAIAYLRQLNFNTASFLEWGLGNSTLFFAPLCKDITSIEHNIDWFNQIQPLLPANATAQLRTGSDYETTPRQSDKRYNVIIVDGIRRQECIHTAVDVLNKDGIIIFDNSDRDPEYCAFLRDHDFIQVDFHGFGPINPYTWTTSIFFSRTSNFSPVTVQPIVPIGGGY